MLYLIFQFAIIGPGCSCLKVFSTYEGHRPTATLCADGTATLCACAQLHTLLDSAQLKSNALFLLGSVGASEDQKENIFFTATVVGIISLLGAIYSNSVPNAPHS